jgi:hypothetical protein
MADRHSSGSSSRRTKTGDSAIGQFIIGAEIGKGSFAQVYMGKHQVRDRSFFFVVFSSFIPASSCLLFRKRVYQVLVFRLPSRALHCPMTVL